MTILFLGVGKMGLPMARHLNAAGHVLQVHDLDPARLSLARQAGLKVVDDVLSQLQAIAPYSAEPLVRLYRFDKDLVKLYLDMGVRGFVFANVESAEMAREIVASTRYPAQGGFRGVAGQQRGNRWGRVHGYAQHAHEQLCLMLQVESVAGVENAKAIAQVEGVDGIFVGPNDLAACLGHMGHSNHPEVQKVIHQVLDTIRACGKAPGILAVVEEDAKRYIEWGYTMVGIGSDQGLLIKASDSLVQRFREHLSHRA